MAARLPKRLGPVLALIPARGGSKRIRRKALRKLGRYGSLLAIAVRQARRLKRAGWIDRILVSTEDPGIRAEALRAGAEVLARPRRLATDSASTLAVARHALAAVPARTLVLLQVTSPLRQDADVAACLRRYARGGASSVVTVAAARPLPEWMFRLKGDRLGAPASRGRGPAVALNGAVYVCDAKRLVKSGFVGRGTAFVRMPRLRSVDVDEPEDLELARRLWKTR